MTYIIIAILVYLLIRQNFSSDKKKSSINSFHHLIRMIAKVLASIIRYFIGVNNTCAMIINEIYIALHPEMCVEARLLFHTWKNCRHQRTENECRVFNEHIKKFKSAVFAGGTSYPNEIGFMTTLLMILWHLTTIISLVVFLVV